MSRFSRYFLMLSLCASLVVPLHGACNAALAGPTEVPSGVSYGLNITANGSGYAFTLVETWARLGGPLASGHSSVTLFSEALNLKFTHRTTSDLPVSYKLVGSNQSSHEACTAELIVQVKGDPELAKLTRRGVIPVVGSTPGANGANFKTSLKLTGGDTQRGRLVFHPIGQAPSDFDPSIPYVFQTHTTIEFDDLMASFGRTGLGSLDIVPEGSNSQLPAAETRIFNQSPEGGTFGTIEPMMVPAEWMGLDGNTETATGVLIPPVPEGMRVNIGVLNLSGNFRGFIEIEHRDGTDNYQFFGMVGPQLFMGSPEQLAFPFTIPPIVAGDRISIGTSGCACIPFYTLTDNKTNDPAITFGPHSSTNVGRYSD
jgi:hypothetical protein